MAAAAGCSKGEGPGVTASPKALAAAPAAPATPQKDAPIRVALLSDPHCQPKTSGLAPGVNGKLSAAVKDLAAFQPDLWIANGDLADNGMLEEHQSFREIMAKVAHPERLLVTTGNHEFYDMETKNDEEELRRFCTAHGKQTAYSNHVFAGIHFVMLATEQWHSVPSNKDWAWLKPQQLRWFDQVLAEHKDKMTLVFLHQPIMDTVVWSGGAGTGQLRELREIIAKHPQIRLWFSGHTHQANEARGQIAVRGRTTYVGLPSTFYNFVPAPAGATGTIGGMKKSFDVSQSRFLEIYPDRVVIKGRDHIAQRWMDEHEYVMRRA